MPSVTISETYDLSTKLNRMSIAGIHTPTMDIVKRSFPGLITNYRMIRVRACSVKLACASVLPADPQAVGVEAGDIAPQDMFNPILYKAMSNRAMSNFELRLHGLGSGVRLHGESIDVINDGVNPEYQASADDFALYYALLANHKGWKVAHPQAGLRMDNLRPYVYEKLFNIGQNEGNTTAGSSFNEDYHSIGSAGEDTNPQAVHVDDANCMYGKSKPLPAFNTTYLNTPVKQDALSEQYIEQNTPKIMPIYVGAIVLPPAKLHILYYRLVIRWRIDFYGVRPIQEILTFNSMAGSGGIFYGTDYTIASSKMESKDTMLDTQGMEVTKIMEGA